MNFVCLAHVHRLKKDSRQGAHIQILGGHLLKQMLRSVNRSIISIELWQSCVSLGSAECLDCDHCLPEEHSGSENVYSFHPQARGWTEYILVLRCSWVWLLFFIINGIIFHVCSLSFFYTLPAFLTEINIRNLPGIKDNFSPICEPIVCKMW
jgi:hypothetical protein